MDTLNPKVHLSVHDLFGQAFDNVQPLSAKHAFSRTANINELASGFVYQAPENSSLG